MTIKQFSDIREGDKLYILDFPELGEVLECYPLDGSINAHKIAGKLVTVEEMAPSTREATWDGTSLFRFPDGTKLRLPITLVDIDKIVLRHESTLPIKKAGRVTIVRDFASEAQMVHHLAAESIQEAWRRFKDCKPAIKLKRISSSSKIVMELAAETIQSGIKRAIARKRSTSASNSVSGSKASSQVASANASTTASATVTPSKNTASSSNKPIVEGIALLKRFDEAAALEEGSQPQPQDSYTYRTISTVSSRRSSVGRATTDLEARTEGGTVIPSAADQPASPLVKVVDVESLLLRFTSVKATNLPSVRWDGRNDVYVRIKVDGSSPSPSSSSSWAMRTDTMWSAGDRAVWLMIDSACGLSRDSMKKLLSSSTSLTAGDADRSAVHENNCHEDVFITVDVFHENLARPDQIIGSNSLPLIDIIQQLQQVQLGEEIEVDVDLYGKARPGVPAMRGEVALKVCLGSGQPTPSYVSTKDESTKAELSALAYASKTALPIDVLAVDAAKEQERGEVAESRFIGDDAKKSGRSTKRDYEDERSSSSFNVRSSKAGGKAAASTTRDDDSKSLSSPHRRGHRRSSGAAAATEAKTSSSGGGRLSSRRGSASTSSISGSASKTARGGGGGGGGTAVTSGSGGGSLSKQWIEQNNHKHKSKHEQDRLSVTKVGDISYRVIDAAFDSALREHPTVTMKPREVLMVLDALGYVFESPLATRLLNEPPDAFVSESEYVELSVSSAAPLAAALSKFVRERRLLGAESELFTLARSSADVGLMHLKGLIEGTWKQSRSLILTICDNSDDAQASGRPSQWSGKTVGRLVRSAQFPQQNFSLCTGKDLLSINGSSDTLSQDYGIVPSLLQARFMVYQHTLQQIEKWWDKGLRPNDIHREFDEIVEETLKAVARKDVAAIAASLKMGGGGGGDGDFNHSSSSSDLRMSISQPPSPRSGGADSQQEVVKGNIEELAKVRAAALLQQSSEFAYNEKCVEIAPSNALLQAWVPINRAYAWGASIEVLSAFSSKLGSTYGIIKQPIGTTNTGTDEAAILQAGATAGCRWVQVSTDSLDKKLRPELVSFLESHISSNNNSRGVFVDLVDSVGEGGGRAAGGVRVLVPITCLRLAPAGVRKIGKVAVAELSDAELVVGTKVMISAEGMLKRSCERFDWWDRPGAESIQHMAGRVGEIVSVAELQMKRRVGVRLIDTDVVDALPVEALLLADVAQQSLLMKLRQSKKKQLGTREKKSTKKTTVQTYMKNRYEDSDGEADRVEADISDAEQSDSSTGYRKEQERERKSKSKKDRDREVAGGRPKSRGRGGRGGGRGGEAVRNSAVASAVGTKINRRSSPATSPTNNKSMSSARLGVDLHSANSSEWLVADDSSSSPRDYKDYDHRHHDTNRPIEIISVSRPKVAAADNILQRSSSGNWKVSPMKEAATRAKAGDMKDDPIDDTPEPKMRSLYRPNSTALAKMESSSSAQLGLSQSQTQSQLQLHSADAKDADDDGINYGGNREDRLKQARRKESQSQFGEDPSSPRSRGSIVPENHEIDYTWLKPWRRLSPTPGEGAGAGAGTSSPPLVVSPKKPLTTLKLLRPEFDEKHASYNDGIYNGGNIRLVRASQPSPQHHRPSSGLAGLAGGSPDRHSSPVAIKKQSLAPRSPLKSLRAGPDNTDAAAAVSEAAAVEVSKNAVKKTGLNQRPKSALASGLRKANKEAQEDALDPLYGPDKLPVFDPPEGSMGVGGAGFNKDGGVRPPYHYPVQSAVTNTPEVPARTKAAATAGRPRSALNSKQQQQQQQQQPGVKSLAGDRPPPVPPLKGMETLSLGVSGLSYNKTTTTTNNTTTKTSTRQQRPQSANASSLPKSRRGGNNQAAEQQEQYDKSAQYAHSARTPGESDIVLDYEKRIKEQGGDGDEEATAKHRASSSSQSSRRASSGNSVGKISARSLGSILNGRKAKTEGDQEVVGDDGDPEVKQREKELRRRELLKSEKEARLKEGVIERDLQRMQQQRGASSSKGSGGGGAGAITSSTDDSRSIPPRRVVV